MTLQAPSQHPHGIDDASFDAMFSRAAPVVFAYHGYPALIHRLTYRRTNHQNFHVHGFQEEGTTTTPFDMAVLNQIDRFHLARAVVDRVPGLAARRAEFSAWVEAKLAAHNSYIRENGEDMPEIRGWVWRS
jgi:xylulose-5-phosphate/fructose-6-phosphate phosphoketolase